MGDCWIPKILSSQAHATGCQKTNLLVKKSQSTWKPGQKKRGDLNKISPVLNLSHLTSFQYLIGTESEHFQADLFYCFLDFDLIEFPGNRDHPENVAIRLEENLGWCLAIHFGR
jgi:hypothetical protein